MTKLFSSFILAFALAVPASSQFLIRLNQGGQTSSLGNGGTVTMNSAAVGQAVTATVTLTYIGTTTANFAQPPQVFGAGDFTVSNSSAAILTPTQSTSFTLQFTPQRATLAQSVLTWLFTEGDSKSYSVISLNLSGTVPAITVSSILSNGNYVAIPAGGSVIFPDTLISANSDVTLAITNRGSGPGVLNSLTVSGDAFQLMGLPLFPVTLAAGAELRITTRFLPKTSGNQSGSLQISTSTGSYTAVLEGAAISKSFDYAFNGASGTQEPFIQPAFGLSLTAPYSVDLHGTLTLSTATNTFAPDPAVQFSTGGVKVPFSIPAGTLAAVFPTGSTQVMIQSGTVAERIIVTPSFSTASGTDLTPTSPATLQIDVPREAPTLLDASIGSVTSSGFTVSVTGFSTTRSLNHLSFQFKGAHGISMPSTATTVDVSTAATFWFESTASQSVGGLFTVEIPFTVAVNGAGSSATLNLAAYIAGISITATNDVGTSTEVQVSVP